MKVSASRVLLPLCLVLSALGVGIFLGEHLSLKNARPASDASFQQEMDAYCTAKLNDGLSNLSPDGEKGITHQSFFSRKLHTCVQVEVTLDPKDAGAMNYVVSDLTHGFVAPPKWHHSSDIPLHVIQTNYGSYHHLYAEGYWLPVSSDPGQQSVADSNAVKLSCEYTDGKRADDESNSCIETEGYTQFGSIQTDTQTYHIASWRSDEVIATNAQRGLSGSTTTTLLIHPESNEIEVVDRTNMNEKQPTFTKGMAGKSFGDHYELHGGMYLIDTQGVFFQCDEDGVVTDMRFDVVQKHHGDVVYVPSSEWNAGSKANHKFTQQECDAAMQKKLGLLH
jgi:hypothetical protein